MYLDTYPNPTLKFQSKAFLRKCYRKLQALFGQNDFVPSGHFYSPIANAKEIEEGIAHRSYNPLDLRGIDLHLEYQKKLLQNFARFYVEMPFTEEKQPLCSFIRQVIHFSAKRGTIAPNGVSIRSGTLY